MPWWQKGEGALEDKSIEIRKIIASYALQNGQAQEEEGEASGEQLSKRTSLSLIAKSLFLTRRRLKVEPAKNLYFLYEPGKQGSSAVKMKNASRSPVAFKFQTNNPKSCFMRPPNGILAPGETLITTVVKFIEAPEHTPQKRMQDKFKIVSLKVKAGTPYSPALFSENKEFVAVERVLRVLFLDPTQEGQSQDIEKLKKRLAEAEAAQQMRKANCLNEIKVEPSNMKNQQMEEESMNHQE